MTIQEQALEHFGNNHQLMKYAEECAEAAAAIIRWKAAPSPETYQQMIEEIADVQFCTYYPRLIFGAEQIDNAIAVKCNRLAETLRGKG